MKELETRKDVDGDVVCGELFVGLEEEEME